MRLIYILLVTSLLAHSDGQYYYRQRPRRMQNYDLASAAENGESASDGGSGDAAGGADGGAGVGSGSCKARAGPPPSGASESHEELNNGCRDRTGSSNRNSGRGMGMNERGKAETAKQHSSGIAIQAAKEAKKANDDMAPAVKAAAEKIKSEYADKATAAANAADAVLFGKGQLLEQLEAEVCNARDMLEPEVQKLATYEANDLLAGKALAQSKRQLKNIVGAIKGAKEKLCTADQLLVVWETSVADGSTIMEAAQRRVNMLMPILNEVIQDREKTKKAAESAARAAEEAKNRIEQMEKNVEGTSNGGCNDNPDRERQRRAWQYNGRFDA